MKSLIHLFLCLAAAGCAGRKTAHVVLRPLSSPVPGPAAIRYPEVVRPYHVGRQVDPDNPALMHEAHPIYRVETESHWDLHPGVVSTQPSASVLNPPADAALTPAPLNDAIAAELYRQQDATERVMWEASQLARSFDGLQNVIQDMTVVASEYAFTKNQIRQAEERLRRLEELVQRITQTPPP